MSWLYLPDAAGVCWPQNGCSDSKLSATSKTTLTESESSRPASGTASSTTPRSGETSRPSTGHPGVDAWILSLRASRASPSPSLASNRARMMSAICGPRQSELFGKHDRLLPSWRTFPVLSHLDTSLPFSTTWLKAATRRFPLLGLQLVTLVPITRGSASGLWPTPTAGHGITGKLRKRRAIIKSGGHKSRLEDAVVMWPTPRANPAMAARITEEASPDRYPNLETVLKKRDPSVVGGYLNPLWIEWLMGVPIGWSALQPLATCKFQQWLRWFGGC